MSRSKPRKVLISGASIAGPALGYWLDRYGFDVTLVERAATIRSGGYAIDVRGTAIDVAERMGILDGLCAAHVETERWVFRDANGVIGSLRQEDITGGIVGRDVEVPRGVVTTLLYGLTRDRIDYRFNDHITALDDHADGIDATFASGGTERFDLVIAADGLHSTTRALIFGPEDQFSKYLGCCFAGFSIPNRHDFHREAVIHTSLGLMASVYETGGEKMNGLLALRRPQPKVSEYGDLPAIRRELKARFANEGWIVPEMLTEIDTAEDFYFDSMMQIHMPAWSKGRFAVVGDAAYGPSFFSGQGTSLALVGAYVLAGELATQPDHETAFAAYDRTARAFVEANQATALNGGDVMVPNSRFKIWVRNRMLGLAPLLTRLGLVGRKSRELNSALKIKDYAMPDNIPSPG